ncbi:MAG TPA: GNAT family N-acetyltransferase [Patescibacteria group bacterium]|nr:GNAT family N-acetyltransferase [Patescibacteria group bacterium]
MDNKDSQSPNGGEFIKPIFATKVFSPEKTGKVNFGPYTEQIYTLLAKLYDHRGQDESAQQIFGQESLNTEATYVVAFDGEKVIGFGMIESDEEIYGSKWKGWVGFGEAYVDEQYRQKGVYKKLVEERLHLALESDAHRVVTKVLHPEQQFQVDYLKRLGFQEADPAQTPTSRDTDLYVLDLDELRKKNEESTSQS